MVRFAVAQNARAKRSWPRKRPGIWECRLIAVGRIDLDDELRIRSANGPGRSGNQVQVVIYPKRVKPYESFGPLLPWDGRVLQKILPGLFTLSINAVPLGLDCAKIFPKNTRTRGPFLSKKTFCVGFHTSLD